MDIRNILGKLDQLNESTMASSKKKPTGPKFVGKMKGTDPASAAKDKYVGGMEESILKELESELKKEPEKRSLVKEFAEFKKDDGDGRSKLVGSIMQLLKAGKKVDFFVPGIRGHVIGSGGQGDWLTLKRWNKPHSRINYSLALNASDDDRFALKMIKPDYYQVVEKDALNEGSAVERKIIRTQQLIQDYYDRSRQTRNDIKKNHYIDMARQLEYDLQGLINDANQAEQDGYDVAQHDAAPSATWNRGGLEEGDLGISKDQETEFHKKLDTLVHDTFGKRKEEMTEDASSLNIGDPVIISGDVRFNGTTGEITEFTRDKHFVIVNLYNHGPHSFHSSDVSYNDYADSDEEEARMYDAGEFRNEIDEAFSELDKAVMEGGHELVKETPVAPAPAQPGQPTLGTDLTKPAGQQNAQQQQQDQKAQQLAAQKAKQEQATLTKGVNALKSAGAAVSNPNQVVKAFGKADNNQGLTPADKSSIASAGTVLAPIMANPSLQGKFKDLVTQASAEQKKEMQQQAKQPQPATTAPAVAPGPAGQVKWTYTT